MPRPMPKAVMLVPSAATVDTAPPVPPWRLGMRRFLTGLIAVLPFAIDAAISLVNQGQLHIPPQYSALWAVFVLAYQGYAKQERAKATTQDAHRLRQSGLPVGQPLSTETVKAALFTERHLPEYVPPPPRRSP